MSDYPVQIVVDGFIALIGGSGVSGLLAYRLQKKRIPSEARQLDADAEVSLSDGALRRLEAAEQRAERAENKADKASADVLKMRRQLFAYETWADQHQAWDGEAVTQVTALGGTLRPPPQLVIFPRGA